jgi:SAM-dependent methyltransferase
MPDETVIKAHWESKPCDICGETDNLIPLGKRVYRRPTTLGDFEFEHNDVICGSCGFVFAGKVPDEKFLADYYKQTLTECLPTFDVEARLEMIREFLHPPASILELGSNAGDFAQALEKEKYSVSCYDIMDETSELPGDTKFDMVAGYYILEHLPYPRRWLAVARQYVKPDGFLLIEVPNFGRTPGPSMFPEHLVHFTREHMKILLESMGFEILKMEKGKHSRYFGFVTVARFILDKRIQMLTRQYNNP